MFTGLIESIGTIRAVRRSGETARLDIEAAAFGSQLTRGESVAVDGACLTVETFSDESFTAFLSSETLERTTLGDAQAGRRVNLERALKMGDRLGGHMVSGHVDAVGSFTGLEHQGEGWLLSVEAPETILDISVPKGSITVDGISLTLVDIETKSFTVAVIAETFGATTLQFRKPGDAVNLESDMLGKYVAKAIQNQTGNTHEKKEANPATPLDLLLAK
jgi:riboflavin synthase